MKKVAFITDRLLSGGKERRMIALIQGLIARKNISPILILWDGKDAESSIAYKYVLDFNIPIYYLGNNSRFHNTFAVYDILKKEHIEVVSFWAPPVYSYFMLYSQLRLKLKMYNSSITNGGDFFTKKEKLIGHNIFLLSDVVLSNSNRALEVFNIPMNKRKVIYNGFSFSRLSNLIPQQQIRDMFKVHTKYIVSMAGEFSIRKDWPTHIKAANYILDKGYDVTFLNMGSGDFLQYKKLVKAEYIDRIQFLGRQSIVESIFNASDICVLSTRGEGISNSILEGMALGKPIVATEGGGTPEIIEQGQSGYITKYKDYKEYAERIIQLLESPNLREQMGKRGLDIVKNKFSIDKMIVEFEKLFLK